MQRLSQSPIHDVASSSSHKRLALIPLNRKQSRIIARNSRRLRNVVSLAAAHSTANALVTVKVVERTLADTLKPLPRAVESVAGVQLALLPVLHVVVLAVDSDACLFIAGLGDSARPSRQQGMFGCSMLYYHIQVWLSRLIIVALLPCR